MCFLKQCSGQLVRLLVFFSGDQSLNEKENGLSSTENLTLLKCTTLKSHILKRMFKASHTKQFSPTVFLVLLWQLLISYQTQCLH